jgi:hypothetical protein
VKALHWLNDQLVVMGIVLEDEHDIRWLEAKVGSLKQIKQLFIQEVWISQMSLIRHD